MGTPSLELTGSWVNADLKGINQYTYWVMPVGLLLQGAWFKVFGGWADYRKRVCQAFCVDEARYFLIFPP
ncbi:MAG TPA: hypothetical protein VLI55_16570 [Bryobacteraceae bacterium]|nr:hypothetical protein [Bryobacteraceae bacterium]